MKNLEEFCTSVRLKVIETVERTHTGHIASALSMVEILAVLFNRVLSYRDSVESFNAPCRDHFVLSDCFACCYPQFAEASNAVHLTPKSMLKGFLHHF